MAFFSSIMSKPETFHRLVKKEAGNRLRAYVLSFASASVGVFFFTLTSKDITQLSAFQRWTVGIALILFVITVILCLVELRVDARRFYEIAKQLEKPESERVWEKNESYKKCRIRFIYSSYTTAFIAVVATVIYLLFALI